MTVKDLLRNPYLGPIWSCAKCGHQVYYSSHQNAAGDLFRVCGGCSEEFSDEDDGKNFVVPLVDLSRWLNKHGS